MVPHGRHAAAETKGHVELNAQFPLLEIAAGERLEGVGVVLERVDAGTVGVDQLVAGA